MQYITTLLISLFISFGFVQADTSQDCSVVTVLVSEVDIQPLPGSTSNSMEDTNTTLFAYIGIGTTRRWRRVWNARKGKWSNYMNAHYMRHICDFLVAGVSEWLWKRFVKKTLIPELQLERLHAFFSTRQFHGRLPNLSDYLRGHLDELGELYVKLRYRATFRQMYALGALVLVVVSLLTANPTADMLGAAFGGAAGKLSYKQTNKGVNMKHKQSLREKGVFNAYMKDTLTFKEPLEVEKGVFCKPILDRFLSKYEIFAYHRAGDKLVNRLSGTDREDAVPVVDEDGNAVAPENAMLEIRLSDKHSLALYKGEELRSYKFWNKDGKLINASISEDYEASLKEIGINIHLNEDKEESDTDLPDLVQTGMETIKTDGLCWSSVNDIWVNACKSANLGKIINLEWIQMWTWNKLLKAFRVNQSDAIDSSIQASKVAKYLGRLFSQFRYWTFETLTTKVLDMHSSIDVMKVSDGFIGEMSLKCARKRCGMGRKVHVGNILQITYFTPKGLMKGLVIVVPTNEHGVDLAMYGEQWKTELSYDHSFLGLDRKKGNNTVYLETQTLGNIFPFRKLALTWARNFILDITNRVVAGDIRGPMNRLDLITDEDQMRKSRWTLHRLALHCIDAATPFAINRFWNHYRDMIKKADGLRVQIPGSIRRLGIADMSNLNKPVGKVKKGWVHVEGDAIIFSRADAEVVCLALGDGDFDGDYYLVHHLKGKSIYVPVLDAKGKPILDKEGKPVTEFSHWEGMALLHRQPNQWGEWYLMNVKSDHEPTELLPVDMTGHFHKPEPFAPRDDVQSIPNKLFEHLVSTGEGVEKALENRVPRRWRSKLTYIEGPYTILFNKVHTLLAKNDDRVKRYIDGMRLPDWIHTKGINQMKDVANELYWLFAKSMARMMERSRCMAEAGCTPIEIKEYEDRTRKRIYSEIRSIFNKFSHEERRLIVYALIKKVYVDMPGTTTGDGRVRSRTNDGILNIPGPSCGHRGTCKCYKVDGRFETVEGISDVVIEILVDEGHGVDVEPVAPDVLKLANALFGLNEMSDYDVLSNHELKDVDLTKVNYINKIKHAPSRTAAYLYGGWQFVAQEMYDCEPNELSEGRKVKAQKRFNDSLPNMLDGGLPVEVMDNKLYHDGSLYACVSKAYNIANGTYVINKIEAKGTKVLVTFDLTSRRIAEEGFGSPLHHHKAIGVQHGELKDGRKVTAGTHLVCRAETNNPHDKNAIAVHLADTDGDKIGYIPRGDTYAFRLHHGTKQDVWVGFVATMSSEKVVHFECAK